MIDSKEISSVDTQITLGIFSDILHELFNIFHNGNICCKENDLEGHKIIMIATFETTC